MKTARLRTEDENSRIEMDRRGGGRGGDAGIDSVVSRMAWRRDDVSPFGIEHNHRLALSPSGAILARIPDPVLTRLRIDGSAVMLHFRC